MLSSKTTTLTPNFTSEQSYEFCILQKFLFIHEYTELYTHSLSQKSSPCKSQGLMLHV